MEYWKSVSDCPYIEVSNMGNIRRMLVIKRVKDSHGGMMWRTFTDKSLAITDNGNGYKIVSVYVDGKRKNYYVHRLVAEAFVPGYKEGLVVDHINHDRSDNRAENLEWVTQKENVSRSTHLMCKPKRKCRPTNTGEKYISMIKERHGNGVRYQVKGGRAFRTLEEAITYRNEVMGW